MSMTRRSRVNCLWIAIAVLGGASMAGCGSTGPLSGTVTNAPSGSNSALRFSQCMRANGVPSFPDPGPSGYAAQRHQPPVAGRPERNERVHALPAPVRTLAASTGERAPPGTPTRELHARERRPELPRPR